MPSPCFKIQSLKLIWFALRSYLQHDNYVVHTYAAAGIEKLLRVKDGPKKVQTTDFSRMAVCFWYASRKC
jgi:hypothetical protein